jgi:outer membrane protein assembly factor BamB
MVIRHRSRAVFLSAALFSGAALASLLPAARAQDTLAPAAGDTGDTNTAWLTYGGDLQRTGAINVTLKGAPNLIWRYSSDIAPNDFNTTPLVVGPATQRRIYFAADRYIVCLDGQTGAQIWRTKALQRPITSPITLVSGDAGDMILAVTSSGQLNAFRTNDGGQIWQVPAQAPVQNIAPLLIKTPRGERIMLAIATGRLVAYTLDGQADPTWELRLGSYSATPTVTPAVSTDGQTIYIPTQDKKLYVVDVAGPKISFPIALDTNAFITPVVLDDHLVLVTGTTLQGLKLRTGQTQWRFDMKSPLGSVATRKGVGSAADTIFVGARNGKFYAVNADNGAKLWETDLADSVTGVPLATNEMILVGTRSGLMFGLSPVDGRVLWRYRLNTQRQVVLREREDYDENRSDQPTGNITVGGAAIGADSGARTISQTFGVSSMPAVVGDSIYVLGDNAALYSFSTQPFDADPPQVISPQLSIPNTANKPALQRMDSDKPLLVSGRAPIQLVLELRDDGSGVDPNSIQVTLNNQELPRTALGPFTDTTGRVLINLVEAKNGVSASLDDGLYTVVVKARDYRGNEMNYSGNFLVDNTVPSPAPPRVLDDATNRNN